MTGSGMKYVWYNPLYWIGAIPAMIFLALFMIAIYLAQKQEVARIP